MIIQHGLELRFILEQSIHRSRWKLLESLFGRCEDREWAFTASVSVNPAALIPAANVAKLPATFTVSTMFFVGTVWSVLACSTARPFFD
jgi:hypothetical protein